MLEGSGGGLEALDAQAFEVVAGGLDFGLGFVDAGEDLGENTAKNVLALGISSIWCWSDGLDGVKNELLFCISMHKEGIFE